MFGRRPDGRRIEKIDPIMKITPYIMPERSDAQVYLRHRTDMERMSAYIRAQAEKGQRVSHMQIIMAAYVRAVSNNPAVNRFIMNKQLFARNNCSAAFTILKVTHQPDQGEAVVKIKFDLTDTLYDVRDRMDAAVSIARGEQEQGPGFIDRLLSFVFAVPGLATVIVGLVKFMDRYGICPRFLIEELPFHVGMYITNTASIGLHEVNHHIYNFGNVGLFFGMGTSERVAVEENGTIRLKRFLPIGITADERVCSGAHYARFFADMRKYLDHPELLEQPPAAVRFDEGMAYHEPKPKKA